jgi:ABC-type multidrug transport system ATPase subunit
MSPQQDHQPPAPSPASSLHVPTGADHYSESGYRLSWTRLTKTVEIKDLSTGGLVGRSSLAQPTNTATTKSKTSKDHTQATPTKTILHAVSGVALPGQVLAVMGPSGSGKTSLMNVLSGRSAFESGQLLVNDTPLLHKRDTKRLLQPHVAYVKQSDVFFGHLTVRDQLTYTALLRLPRENKSETASDGGAATTTGRKSNTTSYIHAQVDRMIQQLRLTKVADSPIRMISGGERKRVNIGTELLTNPKIVLLDEPTSTYTDESIIVVVFDEAE